MERMSSKVIVGGGGGGKRERERKRERSCRYPGHIY